MRNQLIPVTTAEISNLAILDGTDYPLEPHRYLRTGDRVRIMEGHFEGLTGIYKRYKNNSERMIVTVDMLQCSVAVEIDGWALKTLD